VTSPLHEEILARIRQHGPITVAEFMELALYHRQHGYYTSRSRRSGKNGDYFTSVDVGPLFGELIAVQLAEMWDVLARSGDRRIDLVEVGAGDGRLTRDILDTIAREHPALYENVRVTLVERSSLARDAQLTTLATHADRIVATLAELPDPRNREPQTTSLSAHEALSEPRTNQLPGQRTTALPVSGSRPPGPPPPGIRPADPRTPGTGFTGVILANELLDALPVHVVTMTNEGPREIYVDQRNRVLIEVEGPVGDARLCERLARIGGGLQPGWRREISLEADRWIARAGAALDRGFVLLFDYAHEWCQFDTGVYANGTLTAYGDHTAGSVHWLSSPGAFDLTSHVDLASIRRAAESVGLHSLGCVDQTYFLLALGLVARLTGSDAGSLRRRLAAKTLMFPGGLGSTMKAIVFAKDAGRPSLRGLGHGRMT
jgi:SAM-dependent MidA family methyltransferase